MITYLQREDNVTLPKDKTICLATKLVSVKASTHLINKSSMYGTFFSVCFVYSYVLSKIPIRWWDTTTIHFQMKVMYVQQSRAHSGTSSNNIKCHSPIKRIEITCVKMVSHFPVSHYATCKIKLITSLIINVSFLNDITQSVWDRK